MDIAESVDPTDPARGPRIELRLSAEEKTLITAKAATAGLSVSAYIRRAALSLPVTPRLTDADRLNLVRIGANLNQALRWANGVGHWPQEIEGLIGQLKTTLQAP